MDEFTDTLKFYQTQRQYEQHGSVYESPRQPPSDADERRVQHLGEPNRSFQEERRAIMSLLQDENVQAHQTFSSSISSIGRSGGSPSTAGTRFHPHPPASPRLPQPPLRPSAAKNMFVSPNAESFEDEPDGVANVYVHELERMHAKRRRSRAMAFRVCILLTISFFLLAIVFVPVVVVELLTRNNNEEPPSETVVIDTGHNETTPGNATADCRIEPVHQECATNGVMHTLPECILENYASLRNDWLPAYDNGWAAYQNGSAEIKSCEPRNLALVTMATDMERKEGSMPNNDSLLNRYVLYTLYFATTGNEWKDSSNWLSSILPECTWFGIHCEVDTNIIHTIELHFNNLDGTIPTEIALLPNLAKLVLESNRLVGALPTVLGNMTSLESLRVQGNRLSGTLPTSVISSPFMHEVELGFNQFEGTIPTEIGMATALHTFGVSFNNLEGSIPSEIGECARLRVVELSDNEFTEPLPASMQNLHKLTTVTVGNPNMIMGSFPEWISSLSDLEFLLMDKSGLNGTLPTEIAALTSLRTLALHFNELSGLLPTEVGTLTELRKLDLGANNLSGTLPTELGMLVELTELDLRENQFMGGLPSEIGLLTNLGSLVVETNMMNGTIPDEVCQLWNVNLTQLGNGLGSACGNQSYGGLACPPSDCCRGCSVEFINDSS